MVCIIGCQVMEQELRALAKRYPQVTRIEILPWGLHIEPDRLLQEITRQIWAVEKSTVQSCWATAVAKPWNV